MHAIFFACGILHSISFLIYLGIIIFSVWRKERMTEFQWWVTASVMLLNVVEIAYTFGWNEQMITSENCGLKQKQFLAFMYLAYYLICILQAVKSNLLFRQVSMFVKKGELPKSFTQSRNFYILLTVAIVAIANYTFYAIYTQVLTKD